MAGGLATRMRPLTNDVPKSMVPILNGKPFLEYQIELLKSHGLKNILLCIGFLGYKIEDYFGDGAEFGVDLLYSYEKEQLLGTGGALKNAEHLLDERFFLLWGDSYVRLDYQKMWAQHKAAKNRLVTISLYRNNDQYDVSNILATNDGQVKLYDKNANLPKMQHIDAGVSVVDKRILAEGPSSRAFAIEDIFRKLSQQGKIAGFNITQRFFEVGSKQGLIDMRKFAESISKKRAVKILEVSK